MTENTSSKNEQLLTLMIEKLTYGGSGLARSEGKTCFIDGVIPGETVRARVDEIRNHYLRATLCDILESSPARVDPACPIASFCGGCQWQHINYAQQLDFKAAILKDCLGRIGKIHDCDAAYPAASPMQTRYRSRAAIKIAVKQKPVMGFYQIKTHDIVQISDCLLLEPTLIQALEICKNMLRDNPQKFNGFAELQLLAVENTPTVLVLWHDLKNRKKKKLVLNVSSGAVEEQYLLAIESIAGLEFLRDAENFYQVNRQQNLAMIRQVLAFMEPVIDGAILDLFCGCGNFSLFLSEKGAKITGIDSNKAAINEARNNARMNGIDNCSFQTANIHNLAESALAEKYDGVIINPPRSGCEQHTLYGLAKKSPSIIVYVSCDPSTLSRDLRVLVDEGYTIDAIQPYDMFPHTYHIETIVKLSK
jgi:23S rRNA (uracil1939-C5)-methyltransferase